MIALGAVQAYGLADNLRVFEQLKPVGTDALGPFGVRRALEGDGYLAHADGLGDVEGEERAQLAGLGGHVDRSSPASRILAAGALPAQEDSRLELADDHAGRGGHRPRTGGVWVGETRGDVLLRAAGVGGGSWGAVGDGSDAARNGAGGVPTARGPAAPISKADESPTRSTSRAKRK